MALWHAVLTPSSLPGPLYARVSLQIRRQGSHGYNPSKAITCTLTVLAQFGWADPIPHCNGPQLRIAASGTSMLERQQPQSRLQAF